MADAQADSTPAPGTSGAPSARSVRPGRSRAVAFGLLLLGSLAGLLLASQRWATVSGSFTPEQHLTGNDMTNALAGLLAGTAAAGTVLAAVSGRRTRTILGVATTLLGVGMAVVVITTDGDIDPATGFGIGIGALGVAYVVAAALVTAGGVVLAARARSWPARHDRFARTRARAATRADADAGEVWKAMDAGFDPTDVADPGDIPGSDPGDMGDRSGRKRPDRGE